jgi:integrase
MTVVVFTDALVRDGLLVPSGKRKAEWTDEIVRCLTLERRATSPHGGTWSYRPKVAGTRAYFRLGSVGELNVAEARRMALLRAGDVPKDNMGPSKLHLPANQAATAKAIGGAKLVPTLSAYYDDIYLPSYAKPRLRSWKKTDGIFRMYLREKFGDCRLDLIDRQEFQAYHVGLVKKPMSPAMADHVARCLHGVLNHAVRMQVIAVSPIVGVRLLRVDNRKEQYMSPDQLQCLMAVLRTDSNVGVSRVAQLLISTGTRLSEATSALWSDIDLANRRWFIPAATAKSKRGRSVPLNDTAIEVLMAIRAADPDHQAAHVFMSAKTGEHLRYVHKVWDRLRQKAGLPTLRIHDLRHQYASFLINQGRSLYEVQKLLGHSSSLVTERYSHLTAGSLMDAANSASIAIKSAMPKAAV